MKFHPQLLLGKTGLRLAAILFTAGLGAGCFSDRPHGIPRESTEALLPRLTSVVAGPVAVLLTNAGGFQSDFTMSFENEAGHPVTLSGWMVGYGGKIRLDAVPGGKERKSKGDVGFGMVWDVTTGQGFAFSEALQGFALMSGSARFTNVLTEVVASGADRIEGHPVDKVNVMVLGDDGTRTPFQMLRAGDLGNLPFQVSSLDQSHSFTLTLSKVQPAVPQAELFLPPDGFTKYDTDSALTTELAIRQQEQSAADRDRSGDYKSFNPTQGMSGPGSPPGGGY